MKKRAGSGGQRLGAAAQCSLAQARGRRPRFLFVIAVACTAFQPATALERDERGWAIGWSSGSSGGMETIVSGSHAALL